MDSDEFDLAVLATAFGKNVRELRSARGMQQEKLALIAGIDRGHMGKIERGETRVTLEKGYLIAKALGVSPASLLP